MKKRTERIPLSVPLILRWARAHRERTGRWPRITSGQVEEAPNENWRAIDMALRYGNRGLKAGKSLPQLLQVYSEEQKLTPERILNWAQTHRRRTGSWPRITSGPLLEAPTENWRAIDMALRYGYRGLSAGSSLPRMLRRHDANEKKRRVG